MNLYYHKTDGGAEYLTDKYIVCPNGHKEGVFEGAKYIVRIDGNIEQDAELRIVGESDLFEKLKELINICTHPKATKTEMRMIAESYRVTIAQAKG